MSHEPPVPPDNQSPYPIEEPPHEHPAPLPPVIEAESGPPRALVIGAFAAGIAAIGGVAAWLLSRGKPRRRRGEA